MPNTDSQKQKDKLLLGKFANSGIYIDFNKCTEEGKSRYDKKNANGAWIGKYPFTKSELHEYQDAIITLNGKIESPISNSGMNNTAKIRFFKRVQESKQFNDEAYLTYDKQLETDDQVLKTMFIYPKKAIELKEMGFSIENQSKCKSCKILTSMYGNLKAVKRLEKEGISCEMQINVEQTLKIVSLLSNIEQAVKIKDLGIGTLKELLERKDSSFVFGEFVKSEKERKVLNDDFGISYEEQLSTRGNLANCLKNTYQKVNYLTENKEFKEKLEPSLNLKTVVLDKHIGIYQFEKMHELMEPDPSRTDGLSYADVIKKKGIPYEEQLSSCINNYTIGGNGNEGLYTQIINRKVNLERIPYLLNKGMSSKQMVSLMNKGFPILDSHNLFKARFDNTSDKSYYESISRTIVEQNNLPITEGQSNYNSVLEDGHFVDQMVNRIILVSKSEREDVDKSLPVIKSVLESNKESFANYLGNESEHFARKASVKYYNGSEHDVASKARVRSREDEEVNLNTDDGSGHIAKKARVTNYLGDESEHVAKKKNIHEEVIKLNTDVVKHITSFLTNIEGVRSFAQVVGKSDITMEGLRKVSKDTDRGSVDSHIERFNQEANTTGREL